MENVSKLKQFVKFVSVFAQIIRFFIRSSLINKSRYGTLRSRAELIQVYSQRVLNILGVQAEFMDIPSNVEGLIVCNHLSYLDILLMSARVPALYITSVETQQSGWVGTLCNLAGCLFVERRKRGSTFLEVGQINRVLEIGVPVVLYPEATSSDGSQILPFKSSLYQCAIETHSPIHHFYVRFNDPRVPYYGDMQMIPHLWKLCGARSIQAQLKYLGEVQAYAHSERRALANRSYEMIQKSHVSCLG